LTDMEYAAGADHLIYGGVFYTIILFLLIFIGERFRDKALSHDVNPAITKKANESDKLRLYSLPVATFVIALFILQFTWLKSIENNKLAIESSYVFNTQSIFTQTDSIKSIRWQPSFEQASETEQGSIKVNGKISIDFFIAAYTNGTGELISSLNKLYDADRWTLIRTKNINIRDSHQRAQLTQLVSPQGEKRIIIHWYQISDKFFANKVKAKLFQTANSLLGKANNNALVAFSLQTFNHELNSEQELTKFIASNSKQLNNIMQSK